MLKDIYSEHTHRNTQNAHTNSTGAKQQAKLLANSDGVTIVSGARASILENKTPYSTWSTEGIK